MSNMMMDSGSSGGNLGCIASISSFIPVYLIREWTLAMGFYMS